MAFNKSLPSSSWSFSLLIQLFCLTGYNVDLMGCIQTLNVWQVAQSLCNQIVKQCQQQHHKVFHVGWNFFCSIESNLQLLDCFTVCLIPRSRRRSLPKQVISVGNSHYIYWYSAPRFAGNRMTNQWFFAVFLQVIIAYSTVANKICYFRVHCWSIYNISIFV